MKATQKLHDLGQSLWLDNITRDLLTSGTLARYIDELSVTGLTSNPTIFDHAIKNSTDYDAAIREKLAEGRSGRGALLRAGARGSDPGRRPVPADPRPDDGVDGWVSLEVSPLLAYDTASTLAAAKDLFARAGRPNLFIKIPGTKEGLPAIEEAIFAGVPVNVTLLFSREHYLAAAEAFLRGIERRIDAGLDPDVGSVASVFVSRWDAAVAGKVPAQLRTSSASRSPSARTRPTAICSTRRAGSVPYNAGRAPATPAVGEHGNEGPEGLGRPLRQGARRAVHRQHHARGDPAGARRPRRGRRAPAGRRRRLRGGAGAFAKAGVDVDALAAQLQDEGAEAFVKSWNDLMAVIAAKSAALAKAS